MHENRNSRHLHQLLYDGGPCCAKKSSCENTTLLGFGKDNKRDLVM